MPEPLLVIIVVAALILLNAFFVAAEFSIVGAPRPAIMRRAESGDRRARLVARILGDAREQDRFIATAQLGITLASLGLGMYGEHALAEWIGNGLNALGAGRWVAAHTIASVTAIALLTYLHIVIGEMIPKTIALQRAESAVLVIAPFMRGIELLCHPFVFALNGVGNAVLRLVGIRRGHGDAEHYRSSADLAYLIQESQASGLLRSEPGRVLAELLDFGDLTAGEVMVPRVRVAGFALGATREDIHRTLIASPHTRYPVYDGTIDRIVGMVHVKDLLRCLPTMTALRREDLRAVPYVPATAPVDEVMSAMRQARAQLAIVLDEHGGTDGILTSEDLFEEVIGDFSDDAKSVDDVRRDVDGGVRAIGVARLERVAETLGVDLEREDVDTISGLVLAVLGHPPVVGDVIVVHGVQVEVTVVRGLGVAEARVTRLPGTVSDRRTV